MTDTVVAPFKLVEDCRYGRFVVPAKDVYVGEALVKYGEYSQIELDLLLQFVTKQTRVVIAGGNIGSLVVPLAQVAGEIVVFEPQRWVFQVLCANIVLNGLTNVRAYWAGAGQRHGVVSVPVLSPEVENNFGALELQSVQAMPGDAVPVYALDKLKPMECGLLTIDVEGMETEVLQGFEQTVMKCRPVIFAEADRELKKKDLFAWLRSHGYELYWYRTPLYNPDNWRKDPENVYQHEGAMIVAHNVLAIPSERGVKLTGFVPVLE